MQSTAHFPHFSIEINREEIPVDTLSPAKVPDEKWKYVDKKGHGHFWDDDKLPTLEWIITGTTWVGDEYDASEIEIGEYRCRQCGATIEPGKKLEYGPSHIPGPTFVTISIEDEEFVLNPEEYAESIQAWAKILRKLRVSSG